MNSKKDKRNHTDTCPNWIFAKTQKPRNTLNMASYDLEVEQAKAEVTLTEALEAKEATAGGTSEIKCPNLNLRKTSQPSSRWVQEQIVELYVLKSDSYVIWRDCQPLYLICH